MSITHRVTDGIADVLIDVPPVNALKVADWFELADTVRRLGADSEVRVVILRAGGGDAPGPAGAAAPDAGHGVPGRDGDGGGAPRIRVGAPGGGPWGARVRRARGRGSHRGQAPHNHPPGQGVPERHRPRRPEAE